MLRIVRLGLARHGLHARCFGGLLLGAVVFVEPVQAPLVERQLLIEGKPPITKRPFESLS